MRWLLDAVGRVSERTGRLEISGAVVNTPSPLLTSRGGLLPHLTKETLAHLPWAQGAPILTPFPTYFPGPAVYQRKADVSGPWMFY